MRTNISLGEFKKSLKDEHLLRTTFILFPLSVHFRYYIHTL